MYKFIKTSDNDNRYDCNTIEFSINNDEIELTELLHEFKLFLTACGYAIDFPDRLELLEPNEFAVSDSMYQELDARLDKLEEDDMRLEGKSI